MKTTNKLFKEQVQDHIITCLSEDETTVLVEQLTHAWSDFKNWYGPYEQKRTPNIQAAFIEWLKGLPSSLTIEYTYYNIGETLKKWVTKCDTPYKETSGDEQAELYYALVYREFKTLCKQNNVGVSI